MLRRLLLKLANSTPLTRTALKGVMAIYCRRFGTKVTFEKEVVSIRKGERVILINAKLFIYAEALSRMFDVFFSAVRPAECGGLQVVDYSKPQLHTLANGLQFEFSSFPEEIEATEGYVRQYKPKAGDVVYDLGAHCGLSAFHFSKMVGSTGRVVCFEPDPANLELLKRNVARHHLENVTIVPSAVGGSEGTAWFSAEGTISSGIASYINRAPAGKLIEVPMTKLGTAFHRYGVPNFCKMDIEGAEIDVLKGACAELSDKNINFAIDTAHVVEGNNTASRLEEIFRSIGYEAETEGGKFFITTYARPVVEDPAAHAQ